MCVWGYSGSIFSEHIIQELGRPSSASMENLPSGGAVQAAGLNSTEGRLGAVLMNLDLRFSQRLLDEASCRRSHYTVQWLQDEASLCKGWLSCRFKMRLACAKAGLSCSIAHVRGGAWLVRPEGKVEDVA